MVDIASAEHTPAAPPPAPKNDVNVTQVPIPGASSGGKNRLRLDVQPTQPAPQGEPETPQERPGWLPEKFKSPEELARAYGELERRMGLPPAPKEQPAQPEATAKPEAQPQAGRGLYDRLTQEYASTGDVSPEARQAFEKQTGLPAEVIDGYLDHLKTRGERASQMAIQRLGGAHAVQELMEWAQGNITPGERDAFNRLVYSGDEAQAALALDGLAAKYEHTVGRTPKIMAGRKPRQDMGGVVAFQSPAEWTAARKDPRYHADPAYRAQVEDRLRAAMAQGLI